MDDLDSVLATEAVKSKITTEQHLAEIDAPESVLRETLRQQVRALLDQLPEYKHQDVLRSTARGHFWLQECQDPRFIIAERHLSAYPHVKIAHSLDQGKNTPVVVKTTRQSDPFDIQMEHRHAQVIADHQRKQQLQGLVTPRFLQGEARNDIVVYEYVQAPNGQCTTFTSISADDNKIKGRKVKWLLQLLIDAGKSLQEMHLLGMTHQDFMDEQLFLGGNGLKIGDFGSIVHLDEKIHLVRTAIHAHTAPYRQSPFDQSKWISVNSRPDFYRWQELFFRRTANRTVERILLEPEILKHFDAVAFMLVVLDMLLLSNGTRRQYEQNNARPILSGKSRDITYAFKIGCEHYFQRHPSRTKEILTVLLQIWEQSKKLWTLEPAGYTLPTYLDDLRQLCDALPDESS